MNKDQLLEKAKREYPPGTEFISYFGTKDTVKEDSIYGVSGIGDICCDGIRANGRVIYSKYDNSWAKILSKKENPMKKKIIGYRLLKDSPELDAGTDLLYKSGKFWYRTNDTDDTLCYSDETVSNTNWFEPIYEEEKIKIGDYEAQFSDYAVKFGCEKIKIEDIEILRKAQKLCSRLHLTIFDHGGFNYKGNLGINREAEGIFKHFNL